MTIDEYKKKLISVVENMAREHGCEVNWVHIGSTIRSENGMKIFRVEINA